MRQSSSKQRPTAVKAQSIVARDLMTEDPMVVEATTSIAEALDILASLEIRHLPVMRGSELVGMLSDRDAQPFLRDDRSSTRAVSSIMNTNVISVEPDASLAEIAATLVDNRIGAVPVVDGRDGELVGIVSYVDVLRDLAANA